MKPGLLRHRITVQKQHQKQDKYGQTHVKWVNVGTFWARVSESSAKALLDAQSEKQETSATVLMRYRKDIDHNMRFIFDDFIYDIKTVSQDVLKTELTLTCERGVRYEI